MSHFNMGTGDFIKPTCPYVKVLIRPITEFYHRVAAKHVSFESCRCVYWCVTCSVNRPGRVQPSLDQTTAISFILKTSLDHGHKAIDSIGENIQPTVDIRLWCFPTSDTVSSLHCLNTQLWIPAYPLHFVDRDPIRSYLIGRVFKPDMISSHATL